MQHYIDNDWRAKIARDYFAMTWNGPFGNGIKNGEDNIENLLKIIDETFHHDYTFTRPDGSIINSGTDKLKEILVKLTKPLINLLMTSFDIIAVNENENSVTFQSTAIADNKSTLERYTQYLRLTYVFKEKRVTRTIVHYHTNYEF